MRGSLGYASGPCYGELAAILLVGLVHVVTELVFSVKMATIYNVVVSIAFLIYLLWRGKRSRGALRAWGMRRDNFWPALRAQGLFAIVGVAAVLGYGVAMGSVNLPATFWITVAIYPIWGIAQQFALQALIARNLTGMLRNPWAIALAASVLFAASHYPRIELVSLTLVAGIFLTRIYQRFPNLWAVGTVHGILGSIAFYVVLGEDPGAAILDFLLSR